METRTGLAVEQAIGSGLAVGQETGIDHGAAAENDIEPVTTVSAGTGPPSEETDTGGQAVAGSYPGDLKRKPPKDFGTLAVA